MLYLFLWLPSALAQFTCNTPTSGSMSTETILAQGDKTILCVHFLPYQVKVGFQLEVDRFVSLSVRRIFEVMNAGDTDLVLQLANSEKLSNQIPYIRKNGDRVYPVMNILINLDMGKIFNVTVEDITEACPDSAIAESILNLNLLISSTSSVNNCKVPLCVAQDNEKGRCDFKIFISWAGTDKMGNSLISASERIINFRNYNIEGVFNSILDINNSLDPNVPDGFNKKSMSEDVQARIENPPLKNS